MKQKSTGLSTTVKTVLLLSFIGGFTVLANAHHGTSTFDGNTTITLEGEIVRFNWTNPHGSLVLAVQNEDGETIEYLVESDGPSILRPLGVNQDSLMPGDNVIAYVSPSRLADDPTVLGREIIKEDGSVIGLSVAYTRRLERDNAPLTDSVIGTWVPDQRALFEFVGTRATWQITAAGQSSVAAYDILAPFSQSECIPATSPTLMMYPTAKVLVEEGDIITLNADWMGAMRTVYMDGRGHPDASERFWHGHSTGHWEGSTLVVDTRNYSDNAIGNAFGLASGINKHLLERFELAENGRSLSYQYELEDSDYLLATVSGSYVWHYRPDISASTVNCDVDIAGQHLSE